MTAISTVSPPVAPEAGAQALTAMVPIIPGHRAALLEVLAAFRARIEAGGPTPLDEIGTVHFARWVVLPGEPDAGTLLFTSNFDGPWDTYLEDFASQAAASFDAIFSHCEGWPEQGVGDVAAFKDFVRRHEVAEQVYYRAYPAATVRQVRSALRLKAAVTTLLHALND